MQSPKQVVCSVYWHGRTGLNGHVTMADSLFEAIRNSCRWCATNPHWRGDQPSPENLFRVIVSGAGKTYYVRGASVFQSRT